MTAPIHTRGRARNRREGGFTLIELMLSVAVIAVLVTTITLGAGFLDNARIQTVIQDIQTLREAAGRWLERGRLDYSSLSVSALKTDGELPGAWGAAHPYGGTYTVVPSATDATHLTVTASALPTAVGNTLVNHYTGRAQSVSFTSGTLTVTF